MAVMAVMAVMALRRRRARCTAPGVHRNARRHKGWLLDTNKAATATAHAASKPRRLPCRPSRPARVNPN